MPVRFCPHPPAFATNAQPVPATFPNGLLDHENTDADWSAISGNWGSFRWISSTRRLEFESSKLEKAPMIFLVPEFPQGMLFANEELRSIVNKNRLTGFVFQPVWSKTTGGIFQTLEMESGGMIDIPSKADIRRRRQSAREVVASRTSPQFHPDLKNIV